MTKEYKANNIVEATSLRDYYLARANLITGSLTSFPNTVKVLENGKIINKEIQYNQTFTKQIDELIQNAVDENVRTHGDYANKIIIKIDQDLGYVTVSDNGRGLPIDTYVMASTKFMTSSNFEFMDGASDTSDTVGMNGIGSKLVPLFSEDYQLTTVTLEGDRGIVKCQNNMSNITNKEDKAPQSVTNGVTVKFKPDFERLKMDGISDDIINHIHALLINIAYAKPHIEFIFQGKQVKVRDFKEFVKYYADNFSILQDDNQISLAVIPTDEDKFVHIVNSLDLNKGGVALDYISNNVINGFTTRLKKGYSKITNGSVKSKIGVILALKDMKNLRFGGGQTKEELKNTVTELGLPTLKYSDFAEILFKNQNIRNPIIELYKIQQEFENRKKDTFERTDKKEVFNPKFFKATKENKFLFIAEGDSALASLPDAIGRDYNGFLPLTGKPQNALKTVTAKLIKNERVQDIINAFGLGLDTPNYENIVVASDADLDGTHIFCLILALVYKLQPNLLKNGNVYRLVTPVITVTKGKELVKWYFTLDEYNNDKDNIPSGTTINYMKGLGSYSAPLYRQLFEKLGSYRNCLKQVEFKEGDEKILENWMNDNAEDVDFRKSVLSKKSFNIENL